MATYLNKSDISPVSSDTTNLSTLDGHSVIIRLGIALGYFKKDLDGACRGTTMVWLFDSLIQKEDRYHKIVTKIKSEEETLPEAINQAREKVRHGEPLTTEDERLFQILAFYNAVELNSNPDDHIDLFDAVLTQTDTESISKIAAPDAIIDAGGPRRVYFEPGIYTQAELTDYLNTISTAIEVSYEKSQIIGLILTSCAHAIGLTYTTKEGRWRMMDINRSKILSFARDKVPSLSGYLLDGFNATLSSDPPPHFTALSTEIFTTALDEKLVLLTTHLAPIKETLPISDEIASREGAVNLAWKAAQDGNTRTLENLAKIGANLNKPYLGYTPIFMAVQNGHTEALEFFLKSGIDVNQRNFEGCTPAYKAATNRQADALKMLIGFGADSNLANSDDFTPLMTAAENDDVNIIEILLSTSIELNKKHPSGATAVLLAAQNGNAKTLLSLLNAGADPNPAYSHNGASGVYMAAQNGHTDALHVLAERHAALDNQEKIKGETPAWIAAQNGHADVLRVLAKHHADLNKPNKYGATPAYVAVTITHIDHHDA